jgi:hypothetical protein
MDWESEECGWAAIRRKAWKIQQDESPRQAVRRPFQPIEAPLAENVRKNVAGGNSGWREEAKIVNLIRMLA